MPDSAPNLDRYVRQMRYPPLGEAGQRKLAASRVLVCGCGALGSVLSETLVRAGVGHVRIVDRDFLETSNLQRQVLFDEDDVARQLPKTIAAAEKLRRINSQVEIDPVVADVDSTNIEEFARGAEMIVDGTDNFQTRFLINDYCVKTRRPWVFAGVVRAEAQVMTIIPGQTACLRCVMESPPPACTDPSCREAGVLGPAVSAIASIEGLEAMKILGGRLETISPYLLRFDLWSNTMQRIRLDGPQDDPPCPCCGLGEFEYLEP